MERLCWSVRSRANSHARRAPMVAAPAIQAGRQRPSRRRTCICSMPARDRAVAAAAACGGCSVSSSGLGVCSGVERGPVVVESRFRIRYHQASQHGQDRKQRQSNVVHCCAAILRKKRVIRRRSRRADDTEPGQFRRRAVNCRRRRGVCHYVILGRRHCDSTGGVYSHEVGVLAGGGACTTVCDIRRHNQCGVAR